MVTDGMGKELVQDMSHQVGRLWRPSVNLDSVGDKVVNDLGTNILKEFCLNVGTSVFVFPLPVGLDTFESRLRRLAYWSKEEPQAAQFILVRFAGTGCYEVFAKSFQTPR